MNSVRRIVVFLPNWVGDAVMATPTLRALRDHFGLSTEMIGIMKPHIEDVLRETPWLDEVWHYDAHSSDSRLRAQALVGRLWRHRADLSIHLTNDLRSALVARLGRVRQRVGYERNARGWLLTKRLKPVKNGTKFVPLPALDYYLDIAKAAGCKDLSPRLELATTDEDERAAGNAWASLGLAADESVVTFNNSGAFGGAKLWPEEYCSALAARIATEFGHTVLVLCGPSEEEQSIRIAKQAAHPKVVSLAGHPLSIGLSKACVKRSRCLVSTDSGPRHFGAAFGIPVVALFGPTHIEWSDTHYAREAQLQIPVDCGPCQQRECPEGHHKCMQDLSVEIVFAAVQKALADA